jgi:hypothetical protein
MKGNSSLSLRVCSKQDVENAKSCTPLTGITLFDTPIFRERIGHFLMLKLHTHFAIASQKDLNAQAPKHPQPSAQESTESNSKSGALPSECAQGNRDYRKANHSNLCPPPASAP